MREHAEQWLKILCGILVAILLFQTGRALVRNHPFGNIVLPVPPTLGSSNPEPAPGGPTATSPANGAPMPGKTATLPPTNSPGGTNLVATLNATNLSPTNLPPLSSTNQPTTNALVATNAPVPPTISVSTNGGLSTTNLGSSATNSSLSATNISSSPTNGTPSATNGPVALAGQSAKAHSPHPHRMGPGGPGQPAPDLPPLVQARIGKIVDSELLGPVMHPQPMALLGIAGDVAFLRTDSGETGLVKVGDALGDLKLLRIGINRILVEQNGQPKELTIFSGMGSESLLNTSDKSSNETTNH